MPKHDDGKHPHTNKHKDEDDKHSKNDCHNDEEENHSLNKVLFELIESVAMEEKALALLIQAEADKIEAFIGKNCDFPTKPRNKDILDLNHSVTRMLETIVMKEWLLLKKLESTLEVVHIPRECCND